MKKVAILSIDGGGIRGILPATILVYLEKLLQQKSGRADLKIGDAFDLIAGTSTGGILACLYLMPGEEGHPKYSAEDALDLYLQNGQRIFSRTLLRGIETVDGIIDEKYSWRNLYEVLGQYFGDLDLAQFIKPCLITSYDIAGRRAIFFTSYDAAQYAGSNFLIKDVARATSAAPTYFEPAYIQSKDLRYWALIDGGVVANNPALCAYAEALKIDFARALPGSGKKRPLGAKDMFLLSLGTGSVKKSYHFDQFRRAGAIKWLEPMIDILMSGNSETVHYELKQLYGTLSAADQTDYYRIEPPLLEAHTELDDASEENVARLRDAGLAFVEDNRERLDVVADTILRYCR